MSDLLKINVNEHTEKKSNLTYLSWAWAWAEVLKIDPKATWVAHEYDTGTGPVPCMFLPDESAMVKVSVTIKDDKKTCLLPVMDHRNKAIKQPDAFQINTAIMRCLAKAIGMHGLGLYIYAGEDLPEGETTVPTAANDEPRGPVSKGVAREAWDALGPGAQATLREAAIRPLEFCDIEDYASAYNAIEALGLENEERLAFWSLFEPHHRSALKRVGEKRNKKEAA